jgi:hypothetical protein
MSPMYQRCRLLIFVRVADDSFDASLMRARTPGL